MAMNDIRQPDNEKELKSFKRAIEYLFKYIDNLSSRTDSLRNLLKKGTEWLWTEEHKQSFENPKQKSQIYLDWFTTIQTIRTLSQPTPARYTSA